MGRGSRRSITPGAFRSALAANIMRGHAARAETNVASGQDRFQGKDCRGWLGAVCAIPPYLRQRRIGSTMPPAVRRGEAVPGKEGTMQSRVWTRRHHGQARRSSEYGAACGLSDARRVRLDLDRAPRHVKNQQSPPALSQSARTTPLPSG
jgi:hypothetical protein